MRKKYFKFSVIGGESVFLGLVIWFIFEDRWSSAFIAGQAFLIGLSPFAVNRFFTLTVPQMIHISIIIFLFSTLILGELAKFYVTIWWWDIVLHTVSAMGLALIGLIFLFLGFSRMQLKSSAVIASFFAFSFSVSLAAIWEIFEFAGDYFLDLQIPMQPSNFDTMTDLLAGTIGAAVVSVVGCLFLRGRKNRFLEDIIYEAIENKK